MNLKGNTLFAVKLHQSYFDPLWDIIVVLNLLQHLIKYFFIWSPGYIFAGISVSVRKLPKILDFYQRKVSLGIIFFWKKYCREAPKLIFLKLKKYSNNIVQFCFCVYFGHPFSASNPTSARNFPGRTDITGIFSGNNFLLRKKNRAENWKMAAYLCQSLNLRRVLSNQGGLRGIRSTPPPFADQIFGKAELCLRWAESLVPDKRIHQPIFSGMFLLVRIYSHIQSSTHNIQSEHLNRAYSRDLSRIHMGLETTKIFHLNATNFI